MATNPVEVCNIALSYLGVRERIVSLDPPAKSQEQQILSLFYERVYRRTLGQYPWKFATKRKLLTLIEDDPNSEWSYRYAVPSDLECAQYIEGSARNLPTELLIKWQMEGSESGEARTLMTDQEDPVLVYTTRDANPVIWPEYFTNLLAWNLAATVAMSITAKPDVANMAANAARIALLDSRTSALNEGQKDDALESEFVRARD